MTNALVRAEHQTLARLDPQALIAQAIGAGAGIDTMERLVTLAKEVKAEVAREAWYEAMAEFQRMCPTIKKTATATIATRGGGSYRYRYAPLDEIMSVIQPVMGPLGLSVSWRTPRVTASEVAVTCRISHTFGHHEESGDIVIPIVQGEGGANPMQRVGIATTYAKRYALLGVIGMAPEDDDDATAAGHAEARQGERAPRTPPDTPITESQQRRLWAIARAQGWDESAVKDLLTSFGVEKTSEVPQSQYNVFIDKLKAERKAPAA